MSRCVFTIEARADLQHIHDYIAGDNPRNALRFIDRLEEQCRRLAAQPFIGVARPELDPHCRSFVVPGTRYLIIYRPMSDGVEILHVRHGSMELRRLFG